MNWYHSHVIYVVSDWDPGVDDNPYWDCDTRYLTLCAPLLDTIYTTGPEMTLIWEGVLCQNYSIRMWKGDYALSRPDTGELVTYCLLERKRREGRNWHPWYFLRLRGERGIEVFELTDANGGQAGHEISEEQNGWQNQVTLPVPQLNNFLQDACFKCGSTYHGDTSDSDSETVPPFSPRHSCYKCNPHTSEHPEPGCICLGERLGKDSQDF